MMFTCDGGVILAQVEIERDERGWPEAWWRLAGSAPEFDVGDRKASCERDDVLASRAD
jgi:hypothetical protein